jgi:predicted transcriptional regulator
MLGIISEEEFNKSINDSKNAPSLIRQKNEGGYNGHKTGLSIKKVIADESLESGNVKDIAKEFGVSRQSIDAYKRGDTSTGNQYHDKDLTEFVKSRKNKIADLAMDRLEIAADAITEDKLAAASLRDASSVMKDMASVVRDMTAKDDDGNNMLCSLFSCPDIKKLKITKLLI